MRILVLVPLLISQMPNEKWDGSFPKSAEWDILKTGILVCVPLLTFRDPTSQSKMLGLEIFPHRTCEVKGIGDCECLHTISHMASEKWDVGLKREFPSLTYPTLISHF